MNHGKIVVFAGGPSSEREISLKSGKAVYSALRKQARDVEFFDVGFDLREKLNQFEGAVIFLALHGRFGEDGTVQAMLEESGIPYTGSDARASALAMDKVASKELFTATGLKVPRYEVIRRDSKQDFAIKSGFNAPFVVKPRSEGSSIGLSVVRDRAQIEGAMEGAFKYGGEVIIEEYVNGKELTVGILEGQPLPVIEIVTRHDIYDFNAKYSDEDTKYILPAEISEGDYARVQGCAIRAHQALGCRDFSRVDMRIGASGEIFILELNTIPGMTERSLLPKAARAAGVSFEDLCVKLINLATMRRRGNYAKK